MGWNTVAGMDLRCQNPPSWKGWMRVRRSRKTPVNNIEPAVALSLGLLLVSVNGSHPLALESSGVCHLYSSCTSMFDQPQLSLFCSFHSQSGVV
ncbi:hypothetical protein LIA77_00371 [Sarocladium implicatum]|nr:hypothetical protein LIA77_00371 [Sarocladium implicatum]